MLAGTKSRALYCWQGQLKKMQSRPPEQTWERLQFLTLLPSIKRLLRFPFDQTHTVKLFWIWHHRCWNIFLRRSLWWHLWAVPHSDLSRWVKAIQRMGKLKCQEPLAGPSKSKPKKGSDKLRAVQPNRFNSWCECIHFWVEKVYVGRHIGWR